MILTQLPIGTKVRGKNSGIVFMVGEHEHPGYRGTTLVADNVIGQICLDAPEINNPNERLRMTGYNYYAYSNLHQWLNATGKNWFKPMHEYDIAPSENNIAARRNFYDKHGYNAYEKRPGFLSWFGEAFRDAIYESDLPCIDKKKYCIEYIKAKIFILSTAEIRVNTSAPLLEGSKITIFDEFRNRYAAPSAEGMLNAQWFPAYYNPGQLFSYWLRTPKVNDEGFTCYAHNGNPYSYKFACFPWLCLRPATNVDSSLPVPESANIRGLYLIG
ncbi:MAG: hypothetical protein JW967_01330 [Dehalococcoidales bacterium]|nr:hypothetical protein [Dehalococcoidales bacterium]